MLRCKLLSNPQVIFVGYKQSHPLEHDFVLKIHTTKDITPVQVLQDEINNLITEINGIMRTFQDEITLTTMHGME